MEIEKEVAEFVDTIKKDPFKYYFQNKENKKVKWEEDKVYVDALYQGYLDACRTFKWEKDGKDNKEYIREIFEEKEIVGDMKNYLRADKLESFDEIHKKICVNLIEKCKERTNMTYGQAQKIINMKYTERLKLRDYVEIIAGAPVSLKRKQGLLHKLRATTDLKQRDMEYMKLCCECMNQAVRYLTMESRTIFLIQLMGYDDDSKSDIMDGPYIMTSLEDMKKAVQEYYWNDFDSTWETLYWRVELYLDSKNEIKKNEFLSPMYTYIMDKAGEIQYFIHEKLSLNYLKGPLGSMVERQFYSVCPDLNLPVPYQPGDVLLIDCRPYAPGAFYCLLKEVGDDCCGIQCEYVNPKGEIETGALKHGDYFFNHREVYQYLSPLYKARIVSKDELDWNDYIKGKRKC